MLSTNRFIEEITHKNILKVVLFWYLLLLEETKGYLLSLWSINLSIKRKLTSYLTKNTQCLHYKDQEVNTFYWNNFCYQRQRSRYSDWLHAGKLSGWSSCPGRIKDFLFPTSSIPALRSTKPPIQRVPNTLFPGVKRPGRETDHSPPASVEVKKIWIYTSTSPYAFLA
jgi:hypothetical protein